MFAALFADPGRDRRAPADVRADPTTEPAEDKVKMDEETKKAVDKALKFLAKKQDADGSWGNTAITGFTLLAFMANGHVPNQGDYGKVVAKGVRHLLAAAREDGYLVGPRGGNMYCHGMARSPSRRSTA